MKKGIFALIVLALTAFTTTASAQDNDWSDKTGTVGLGVDANIDGGTGLSIRYFINDAFGLELIVGGQSNSTRAEPSAGGQEVKSSSSSWDFSLLAEYNIGVSRQATLSAYGGLGLGLVSTSQDPSPAIATVDSYTDISFELGLRGEVWLYKFFSIYARGGVLIDPVSDTEAEFGQAETAADQVDSGGMNLGIFRGQLLGAAGFTFWFG